MTEANQLALENAREQIRAAQDAIRIIQEEEKALLLAPQKTCKHTNYYRFWYNEDHLIESCRDCFHEEETSYRPFFFEDYPDLTQGKYEPTEIDARKKEEFHQKLKDIDNLLLVS